jgi:hypothetical protein
MTKKKLKVTIEWELLERIAKFYKFPSAVFLGNMKMFSNSPKTREEGLLKKAEAFNQIKDIMNEFDYDDICPKCKHSVQDCKCGYIKENPDMN